MIAGVVLYTPYVRYWLPAYPLLAMACVLAAAAMFNARQWQLRQPPAMFLAGTGLLILLLLPAPISCINLPWAVYAKHISTEEHLKRWFPEYPAVRQLNAIVDPHEGVICTGCDGVYLVAARPYEFAFWWNDIHRIHDRDSFADFCRRNDIHYWVVNRRTKMGRCVKGSEDIVAEYWSRKRLVTAANGVAVYDVSSPPAASATAKNGKAGGAAGGVR
jgi:hypothetical protein